MGTAYQGEAHMGVIPRAVIHIFDYIKDNFSIDFTVSVSFIELYNEGIFDLLSDKPRDQCGLEIREDVKGNILIPNLTETIVESATQVLDILTKGSNGRATAATSMNLHSSRSHAIFTINIAMQHKFERNQNKNAKLHLVDLAGSERPKKTGAVGTTFKEGVNINKGLFVLGNVISCLGNDKSQQSFVPYRDSNLTRLLKDSLGGNSMTLMIACVSPADYNLEETLSTLRYADRARKIKNKPVINQDPKSAEINELKRQIKHLQLQIVGQGVPVVTEIESNKLCEYNMLKLKIGDLHSRLTELVMDKTYLHEKILILQTANEDVTEKIQQVREEYDLVLENLGTNIESNADVKENVLKFREIREKLSLLQLELVKTETEMRKHEDSLNSIFKTTGKLMAEVPVEIHEKEETHTVHQMHLHSELQDISKQLAMKEQLAKQLQANTRYMVDHMAMAEIEKKITTLEKEKEDLIQQLRNVKTLEASGKIAEQRRKRVQELEQQIKDLTKKVQGQSRLIKLKERDEQRITQLHQEITQMKQVKVKLVKNMREESNKFQQWKLQKERELTRVKQEDQKKQTEIAKIKLMHANQQNVLKRKFEEAAALNKRLQQTLILRKQVQDSKFNGKFDKIGPLLKQEIEIMMNLIELETTLGGLLDDRAILQQQLNELMKNPETAESNETKTIKDDIELRSVQIQDLQLKLVDFDEEKPKIRFDGIQSMAEAKYALKFLFEQSEQFFKKYVQCKNKCSELMEINNVLSEKNERDAHTLKLTEDKYRDILSNQQQVYEEKVAILLRQLRGIENGSQNGDSGLSRCQIQEELIEKQEKQIEEQQKLINKLKNKLEENEKANLEDVPISQNSRKTNKSTVVESIEEDDKLAEPIDASESEDSFSDDLINDPDWRKTPLGKRVIAEKKQIIRQSQISVQDLSRGRKRLSDDGCTCKTKCNSVRCGCRKPNKKCMSTCKCDASVCENRTSSSTNAEVDQAASELIHDFKRPRVDEEMESQIARRRQVPKKLFIPQ
ncbi:chromosome-associated kinesin KIF4 isoform X2 [Cylas formicarius]|nr:chromosome-associated kinesin KIF4 isoform X2 [Cylas formicarius]